jgi:hypothetical protein
MQYEYKVVKVNDIDEKMEKELNDFGKKGWELVSTCLEPYYHRNSGFEVAIFYILKRQKQ